MGFRPHPEYKRKFLRIRDLMSGLSRPSGFGRMRWEKINSLSCDVYWEDVVRQQRETVGTFLGSEGEARAVIISEVVNICNEDGWGVEEEKQDDSEESEAVQNTIRILLDTYGDDDPELAIEKIRNLLEE